MDLKECFIEPERRAPAKRKFPPASYIRRSFYCKKDVRSAQLKITALGLHRTFINGNPVTKELFLPGWTYYPGRLQYHEFDVTGHIGKGENVIGSILGDGWYRGTVGFRSIRNHYGRKTSLSAVLRIEYLDGTMDYVVSDPSWKATQNGPLRKSDWQEGDIYDVRRELEGWNSPGFEDTDWHHVLRSRYEGKIVEFEGESNLEQEVFHPEVIRTPDGSTVLDFKQNMFGYIHFTVTGAAGHCARILHGEVLDAEGNFTTRNLILEESLLKHTRPFQEVRYILKDGQQTYKPIFSAQGFRYAKLIDWPEEVQPENFTGIAVYSDLKETGAFQCSHAGINQLVSNTHWSLKGNFMDIPTDCPSRERAGWTGDIQAFCETGSYLRNTYRFLSRWLKDLSVQQTENGCVASIVPDVGMPSFIDGSAGWGDAAVIVPYKLYKMYGDTRVLREQYDSMKAWVSFCENRAKKASLRSFFRRDPCSQYIVDTGYHWGEWLEPGHSMARDAIKNFFIADAEVATAYFAYSAKLLSRIATVLGKTDDAMRYRILFERIQEAYYQTFTEEGLVVSQRQCRYVRPLALGLLHPEDRKRNAEILNRMVIANDYRIGTGFLTTPHILSVLTDHGYTETAYRMAENEQKPGWLYPISKGATTIWENWNGVDEHGVPRDSMNHYTFGSITGWFFSRVAGIRPMRPGFRQVCIRPMPGGSLTHVDCMFESSYGTIRSQWRIDKGQFRLEVDVPVDARIFLPDGTVHQVQPGSYRYSCNQIRFPSPRAQAAGARVGRQ